MKIAKYYVRFHQLSYFDGNVEKYVTCDSTDKARLIAKRFNNQLKIFRFA